MQKEQAAAGIEPTPLSYDSTTSANFFVVLANVMLEKMTIAAGFWIAPMC